MLTAMSDTLNSTLLWELQGKLSGDLFWNIA